MFRSLGSHFSEIFSSKSKIAIFKQLKKAYSSNSSICIACNLNTYPGLILAISKEQLGPGGVRCHASQSVC